MTRPHRRDKNTKNGSVITGLRLERDVAQALCAEAISRVPDRDGRGDVAEMVRYFIRTGLGDSHEMANRREGEKFRVSGVAGLKLDATSVHRLHAAADARGWPRAAMVRHYVRLGLGFKAKVSEDREEKFAAIAEIRRAEYS